MVFTENLKKSNILINAKAKTRWELIDEMLELAVKNREINAKDSQVIRNALNEREKSMSTGIGNGVAVPHCSTDVVKELIIIMAISSRSIDFDSIDSNPVRIAFLLIVPKEKLSHHIKTLANIAKLMSNESLRSDLLNLKTQNAVLKIIRQFESEHSA